MKTIPELLGAPAGLTGWKWYGLKIDVALRFDPDRRGEPRHELPRIYKPGPRLEDRWARTYAVWPLNHLLEFLRRYSIARWILEEVFWEIGWMEGDDLNAPQFDSLRWGSPRWIISRRVRAAGDAARAGRDYAIARAREEGTRVGSQLTAIQLEELRALVTNVDYARAGYAAHAASFGALVSISLALPGEGAGEVDDYDEVVRRVVDVVEELARYKAASAISAESIVGLSRPAGSSRLTGPEHLREGNMI